MTQAPEDTVDVESQYRVRLSMDVTATNPVDAVNEFINQILLNGLDSYVYSVTDDEDVNHIANTSSSNLAIEVLDDDEEDDEDEDDDEPQEDAEASDNSSPDADFERDGTCERCKDKGKVNADGICMECAADLGQI